MPNIGVWEIVIEVVIALLIFGPKKLPELGSSLGRSITGFKKGLKETKDEMQVAMKEDEGTSTKTEAASTPTTPATATATTTATTTVTAPVTDTTAQPAAAAVTDTPATLDGK